MIELLDNWPAGEPVPAISLMQPWASAVADYGKDVENRSRWNYKHRGPVLIHASSSRPYSEAFERFIEIAKEDGWSDEALTDITPQSYPAALFPHGCIVAVANLAEVFTKENPPPDDHPASGSPWLFEDAGAWLYITDVVSVQEVPFKGFVGIFKVPYDIASALQPWPEVDGPDLQTSR
jgi:hypothetical protein